MKSTIDLVMLLVGVVATAFAAVFIIEKDAARFALNIIVAAVMFWGATR